MVFKKFIIKFKKVSKPFLGRNVYFGMSNKIILVDMFSVCVCLNNKNLMYLGSVERYLNKINGVCYYKCNINKLKLNSWLRKGASFNDSFFFSLFLEHFLKKKINK